MNDINTERVDSFLDYMLFFEYARYLKENNIIKRGLVAPDLETPSGIKKRISSTVLKGLRSENIFNIGDVLSFGKSDISCLNISRNRSNSLINRDYFSFNVKYSMNSFIPLELFNNEPVYTVTDAGHKYNLLKSLCSEQVTEESFERLNDEYELVFIKFQNWSGLDSHYRSKISQGFQNIDNEIIDNEEGLVPERDVNNRYRIINPNTIEVMLKQSMRNNSLNTYYFNNNGGATIKALGKMYIGKDKSVRIPSIIRDASTTVIAQHRLDNILKDGENFPLIDAGPILREMDDSYNNFTLLLCKRRTDEEGVYLAPNMVNSELFIKFKIKDYLFEKPEIFMKYMKRINETIMDIIKGE